MCCQLSRNPPGTSVRQSSQGQTLHSAQPARSPGGQRRSPARQGSPATGQALPPARTRLRDHFPEASSPVANVFSPSVPPSVDRVPGSRQFPSSRLKRLCGSDSPGNPSRGPDDTASITHIIEKGWTSAELAGDQRQGASFLLLNSIEPPDRRAARQTPPPLPRILPCKVRQGPTIAVRCAGWDVAAFAASASCPNKFRLSRFITLHGGSPLRAYRCRKLRVHSTRPNAVRAGFRPKPPHATPPFRGHNARRRRVCHAADVPLHCARQQQRH